MYKIKTINQTPLRKNCLTRFNYINCKKLLVNFGIKRKNVFLRLFARTQDHTKNPIKFEYIIKKVLFKKI